MPYYLVCVLSDDNQSLANATACCFPLTTTYSSSWDLISSRVLFLLYIFIFSVSPTPSPSPCCWTVKKLSYSRFIRGKTRFLHQRLVSEIIRPFTALTFQHTRMFIFPKYLLTSSNYLISPRIADFAWKALAPVARWKHKSFKAASSQRHQGRYCPPPFSVGALGCAG